MKKVITYFVLMLVLGCASDDPFFFDGNTTFKSGSTTKFHISGDYLYVAAEQSLIVFDISNFEELNRVTEIFLPRTIETIFRLGDVLYLGTTTGVLFYDISDPRSPVSLSTYEHLTACDPVVSNGTYAFATLRSGSNCGAAGNLLEVLDVSDISNPLLINSYEMTSPRGLALMGNHLFVGEGEYGMRWFDVSDIQNIRELAFYQDIKALDFVVNNGVLVIATTTSLLQMRLTDQNELIKLSELTYE